MENKCVLFILYFLNGRKDDRAQCNELPEVVYDVGGNRIFPVSTSPSEEEVQRNDAFDKMIENIRSAYEAYFLGEITIDELQIIEDENYFSYYPEERENPNASMSTNLERKAMVETVKAEKFNLENMDEMEIQPYSLGDGTYKYLSMPYEKQETGHWCGPATAVNIVNGYNQYARINQSTAAGLLKTTTNGTGFDMSFWGAVLNSTYMGKTYQRAWGYPGWAADLANKCINTIYYNRGVALNVIMTPETIYLPGYNASMGNVYHYVAGYGFNSTDPSRRKISYLDSNGYYSATFGAKTVSFQDMAKATQINGIIY